MQPRVRSATLSGFVEVSRFVGLDPYDQLRRSGIDVSLLAELENWLAAGPVADLLERCALESGRDDFAVLMAEGRTFASLGPISLVLKHERSPRRIVERLAEFKRHVNEVFGVQIRERNNTSVVHWTFPPKLNRPQVVSLVSAMGYRALTDAMSGTWQPDCIHFAFPTPVQVQTYRRFFRSDLEFSSQLNGLSIRTEKLDVPNPGADDALAGHAVKLLRMVPTPTENIIDRATHSICLLLPMGGASLEAVARNLGIQPRRLQRGLQREGTSFADLLNHTRRELALRYLKGEPIPITQVAAHLGYSSSSAFSRWFSREFGTAAAAWRRTEKADL